MRRYSKATAGICHVCQADFDGDHEGFKEHMVSAHGYMRVGGQVFLRKLCGCGKPGLYQFAGNVYCKDHRQGAVDGRAKTCALLDQNSTERTQNWQARTSRVSVSGKARQTYVGLRRGQ